MSDLIERQALLDAFGLSEKTRKYGGDHSGYNTMMLYEIQDVIEGLPSAEPKTGRWIDTDNYYRRWKCSKCGCHTREDTPFCPNCGADMRGEQNEP